MLGLKGTISEASCTCSARGCAAGACNKATNGELRLVLPAGLECDETGRIRVTPDEAVADAIATVFSYFQQLQLQAGHAAASSLLPAEKLQGV